MYVNITFETRGQKGPHSKKKFYKIDSHDVEKVDTLLFDLHTKYEKQLKLRADHTNKFVVKH